MKQYTTGKEVHVTRTIEATAQELHKIYGQVFEQQNRGRYHEELWQYHRALNTIEGCRLLARFCYELCHIARLEPQGKVFLEAGCGFGAIAITFRLMGAAESHGVDISDTRLITFQRIVEDFKIPAVYAHLASVDALPYTDQYFDVVVSNEAISHYHDVDRFLSEAARVLKPGGVLIIADGNNGANRQLVMHTHQLWERFENGPAGSVDSHHVVTKPYLEMRAELVRQAAPELPEEVVMAIARGTSGMTREQILLEVERYRTSGELPRHYYQKGVCPRNPLSGAVMERLFHPAELAQHIETFGFQARYYARLIGRTSANPLFQLINAIGAAISPLSIRWARAFRIVAVRR